MRCSYVTSDDTILHMPLDLSSLCPRLNEVERGFTGFTLSTRLFLSVCPSVCGRNRVPSVSSTILTGSISYYATDQATSKGVSRVKLCAKFQHLNC